MNAMRKRDSVLSLHQEDGAALVIAILILLILTVVGIYAVTTSTLETKISGVERGFKEAFYTADSGEPVGIDVIKKIIHFLPEVVGDLPTPWNNSGVVDTSLFSGADPEIFTDGRPDPDDTPDDTPDINSKGVGSNLGFPSRVWLRVDIDRLNVYQITGGAQQFAAGYEGIGSGGGGSIGINYALDSLGQYPLMGSASKIEAGYRFVVGMPGGE